MTSQDPYVGEIFQDRDPRMSGRRVRIVGLHKNQTLTTAQMNHKPRLGGEPRVFEAIPVDGHGRQNWHIATRLSTRTIDTKFWKVSH
jgi:hypothetical protein